jgi:hypothetical protein
VNGQNKEKQKNDPDRDAGQPHLLSAAHRTLPNHFPEETFRLIATRWTRLSMIFRTINLMLSAELWQSLNRRRQSLIE